MLTQITPARHNAMFGVRFIILAIAGSIVALFDRVSFENTPIAWYGDHWWVSALILGLTIVFAIVIRIVLGEPFRFAFAEVAALTLIYTVVGIVLNSLWRYGVFLYVPYLTDPSMFFGKDPVVSVIAALGVAIFLHILPIPTQKIQSGDSREVCLAQCREECANTCSISMLQKE